MTDRAGGAPAGEGCEMFDWPAITSPFSCVDEQQCETAGDTRYRIRADQLSRNRRRRACIDNGNAAKYFMGDVGDAGEKKNSRRQTAEVQESAGEQQVAYRCLDEAEILRRQRVLNRVIRAVLMPNVLAAPSSILRY